MARTTPFIARALGKLKHLTPLIVNTPLLVSTVSRL